MKLSDLPPIPAAVNVKIRGVDVAVHPLCIADMDRVSSLFLEPQPPLEVRPSGATVRKVNDPAYAADLRRHNENVLLLETALAIRFDTKDRPCPSVESDTKAWQSWATGAAAELSAALSWAEVERLHAAMRGLCDLNELVKEEQKK